MVTYDYGTCAHCGEEDRLLKYNRRSMCPTYACQMAAKDAVARRRAAAAGVTAEEGASVKVPPAFCYEILEVLGQREVDPSKLVGKKRRNAVADEDRAVSYLVRATFCEDKDDDGFVDVRWVDLDDLVENLDDEDLQPLEEYEKKLARRMSAQRRHLRRA